MAPLTFTVLGGEGFIGRHLVHHLHDLGHRVHVPPRAAIAEGVLIGRDLGQVVYAIGLTGDFRTRLRETVDAHVRRLDELLAGTRWESWLYLSSTRVYGTAEATRARCEDDVLPVRPCADAVYDLSKLLGEALCLARPETTCRVARLANVFGPGMSQSTFLGALAAAVRTRRAVTISEGAESSKDYLPVAAAVTALARIALAGRHRIYNVASGRPITHRALAKVLEDVADVSVAFAVDGSTRRFPPIDVSRFEAEFHPVVVAVEDAVRTFFAAEAQTTETDHARR